MQDVMEYGLSKSDKLFELAIKNLGGTILTLRQFVPLNLAPDNLSPTTGLL